MAEDSRPATKQDLNQLREEMRQLGDHLVEQMRDRETEVLRAFHDWASPVEIKLRAIPPIDQRLAPYRSTRQPAGTRQAPALIAEQGAVNTRRIWARARSGRGGRQATGSSVGASRRSRAR
jgi:hypothetical protein